ncbi:MAG: ATP-binding cassette domain-containing protein [Candidatus Altiarchaeota archaeon]|nr:ATP-binding cassette domain-containing protein [Candidatus Altiarchaeota archaeon]
MTGHSAIELKDLSKRYGELKAVDCVSLSVEQGSVFGLLGPNGAGKTTLISMLVTMRRPTSGTALVNGFGISREADSVRKSIGIVFQDPSLDDELTARENLRIHMSMYGVPKELREKRLEELIRIVGLEDKLNVVVKHFSGGMRRRLEIARGLLHHPKVLFLDEPTIGLDPQTRAGIWGYIEKLNKSEKITIVLTTHYMDEADKVCDKVAIIDHGRIIASGTPEGLKNELGGDVISIKCDDGASCIENLNRLSWIKSAVQYDGHINIRVGRGEEKIPRILSLMEKHGIKVESVSLRKPSLDDVFLHYTGRTIREDEASPKDAMRLRKRAWGGR